MKQEKPAPHIFNGGRLRLCKVITGDKEDVTNKYIPGIGRKEAPNGSSVIFSSNLIDRESPDKNGCLDICIRLVLPYCRESRM